MKCFRSFPINNISAIEDWFTINHVHDAATVEFDAPLFIGEILISTGFNNLVNLDR